MGEFYLFYYLRNFRTESTDPTDSATDLTVLQRMTTIAFNLTVYLYFIFSNRSVSVCDIFAISVIIFNSCYSLSDEVILKIPMNILTVN